MEDEVLPTNKLMEDSQADEENEEDMIDESIKQLPELVADFVSLKKCSVI